MSEKDMEYIRVAAYYMWENAGKPEGKDEEFWWKACEQFGSCCCCCCEKKETKPAAKKAPATIKAADDSKKKVTSSKTYHVSKRKDDGKWQVKFANGKKALKLFDTQAEAINFAEEKADNQDANITIHKVDGKIRKQDYSKKEEK
jgi:hypothetical protein